MIQMKDALDAAELLDVGAALKELKGTRGWGMFLGLLEKFEQDVGRRGLRDRERPRSYWEGFADAIVEVRQSVDTLIAEADDVRVSAESEARALLMPRVGVGASVSGS